MKRIGLFLCMIFICNFTHAKTETINWYVDGQNYTTTQCETGSDIILPQPPYKYGYTFRGWNTYVPIKYLESTGTQYIDTGVIPKQRYTYKTSFMWLYGTASNGALFLVGGENNSWFGIEYGYTPMFFGGYSNSDFFKTDTKYSLIMSQEQCEINGIVIPMIKGSNVVYSNMRLFSGINAYYSKAQIYYFQIYDNDVLVRDFIPVLDQYGVPCMYDKVEDKFYYNQGTGQFIAGPMI